MSMPDFTFPETLWWLCILPAGWWLGSRQRAIPKWRAVLVSALRTVALSAVIIALAGPFGRHTASGSSVIFVLDKSSSISDEIFAEGINFVQSAVRLKPVRTQVGMVVFGAAPAMENALGESPVISADVQSFVDSGATDIGAAIELGLANLPSDGQRRLVIVSDGAQTVGDASAAAGAARALGVELFAVALESESPSDEIRVRGISAPTWVHAHEPFELHASVQSSGHASGTVVVLRDGVAIHEAPITLIPGHNRISVADQIPSRGLREYEVLINSDADTQFENNRFRTFVEVRGPPRVLHAYGQAGDERALTQALRVQGITVDEVQGKLFPAQRHQLHDYDLVILNNVPGLDLTLAKMALLEQFVRDSGAGVISIGGSKAYGAGGYYGTPLEALLPVNMDIKTDVSIPITAVNILIDKSGSMSAEVQGRQKLAIAKRAALAAIEVLNPLDKIGVLAFDSAFEWTVAPTLAGEQRAIADSLSRMSVGGGTELFSALSEAHRVTNSQQAKVKHLIVLSDGLTESGADFEKLSRAIAADGITISTVAFGADADQTLMQGIATLGGGRYYFASDPQNIPRIFTSETLMITRDLFVEERVVPTISALDEMLSGFESTPFPALLGYQRTFPKPAAQTLLSVGDDPLLAIWRYGLGRSAAFTSDLTGRWGGAWTQWSEFSRFAAQMARWAMRRRGEGELTAAFAVEDQQGTITVDALDRDDKFINELTLSASVSGRTGTPVLTALTQVGPGRYRGTFPIERGQRYFVTVAPATPSLGPKLFGLAVPYSSEFLGLGVNVQLLEDLARESGQGVLPASKASLETILSQSPDTTAEHRIWWPWFLLALVALVAEVGVRKISRQRNIGN
ncbi:MAG: VWA domain-containing protein [Gammaproteobacteria bacterium]|nr:VWA domain-containing protein [Gammaproteobacteria bacterium]